MRNPNRQQAAQNSAGPDLDTLKQLVRQAVGKNLAGLSEATQAAKEARRLLEVAHSTGDREAEDALRQALDLLAAAAGRRLG